MNARQTIEVNQQMIQDLLYSAKKLAKLKNISIADAIDYKVSVYEKYAKKSNEAVAWYLGQKLQEFRESRNLSRYAVAKKGNIRIEQVKAVEEGVTNYTIDVFLGYISGSDLYMYFAEKDNENNLKDLIDKIKKRPGLLPAK